MLAPLSDRKEIADAERQLEKLLSRYENYRADVLITSPGGVFEDEVSYSKKLNVWWTRKLSINFKRKYYINIFGTNEPHLKGGNTITVAANCSVASFTRMYAGLWARDEKNNIWLLHSGRIGGGKEGIGKQSFWNFYKGPKEEVDFEYDKFEYAVIGKLNDKKLPERISEFVYSVERIKNVILSKGQKTKKIIHNYSPEYTGTHGYGMPEKGTADVTHGFVVDALKKSLETDFKMEAANNRFIDLYTIKTKGKPRINFEIKTGLSRQQVYTAIGQLLLNSSNDKAKPKLVFVCLDKIRNDLVGDLKKFNIKVLKYRWRKDTPVFTNLNSVLN